ncbi:hypothetical protein GJV11_11410 [Enterobacteriaceae bacterium RIT693]|jgi:DNA-binding NarL/FixJ family response regulator|nr:hypothetical protein [Enterobacteriaceae bacterium RIT693]
MISIRIDRLMEEQLRAKDITADKIEELISNFFCINRIGVSFVIDTNKGKESFYLSEQQRKIVFLSSRGLTYKAIGEKLNIEVTTVKFHMRRIKETLNVSTLGQVIKVAIESDII